jgi:hypothetical protein
MKTTILFINGKNMIVCDELKCKNCSLKITCKGETPCQRDLTLGEPQQLTLK